MLKIKNIIIKAIIEIHSKESLKTGWYFTWRTALFWLITVGPIYIILLIFQVDKDIRYLILQILGVIIYLYCYNIITKNLKEERKIDTKIRMFGGKLYVLTYLIGKPFSLLSNKLHSLVYSTNSKWYYFVVYLIFLLYMLYLLTCILGYCFKIIIEMSEKNSKKES